MARTESTVTSPEGRPRFVGPEFCQELSELTGIELAVINSAFAGERTNIALDAVKTIVAENLDKGPEAWTEILRERAKAEGMGEYRPGYWDGYELTWEHNEHGLWRMTWHRAGQVQYGWG